MLDIKRHTEVRKVSWQISDVFRIVRLIDSLSGPTKAGRAAPDPPAWINNARQDVDGCDAPLLEKLKLQWKAGFGRQDLAATSGQS